MEEGKSNQRKRRPFFSVIIPTYNRKKRVTRAIESVLNQSWKDFEIIVVDDGSKDGTRKKLKKRFGSKIRLIYQKNKGPSSARNKGIRSARGKYIAFLDSDDQYLPDKLRQNKKFLKRHPRCKFLYSWYYDIRSNRRKIMVQKPKACRTLDQFRHALYRRKFTIRTSSAVIHRRCFDKVGVFNKKYRYSQDWDMWLRLASRYKGCCQKKTLVTYYRVNKKRNRRKIRSYHRRIRKNIRKVYHWNRRTIKRLDKKYGR